MTTQTEDALVFTDTYTVWYDQEVNDPSDPDLVSRGVVLGEYPDRVEAMQAAREISKTERTMSMVEDHSRPSKLRPGQFLLIGGFVNGRPA